MIDGMRTKKPRVYGISAAFPDGFEEDAALCVQAIWDDDIGGGERQCSRKRGHGKDGLYCKQHSKIAHNSNN